MAAGPAADAVGAGGLDALDDEVSLAGTAADDADQVDVLKIENLRIKNFKVPPEGT